MTIQKTYHDFGRILYKLKKKQNIRESFLTISIVQPQTYLFIF